MSTQLLMPAGQVTQVAVERIRDALDQSPLYDVRLVHVEAMGDRIILSGKVSCFYHKQMAQKLIHFAYQAENLVDDIRVTLHK